MLWILQSFSEQLPNRAPVQGLHTTSFTALWSFLLGNSRNSCNSSRNSTLAGIYLFRVNNEIIRITYQWNYEQQWNYQKLSECEICSKLTIKTTKLVSWCYWIDFKDCSGVSIVDSKQVNDVNDVALVSLWTSSYYFECWLWTSKFRLSMLKNFFLNVFLANIYQENIACSRCSKKLLPWEYWKPTRKYPSLQR